MTFDFLKIRLVVFDFDGVLIKKMPDHFPASLFEEFMINRDNFHENSTIRFEGTNWIKELKKSGINTDDKKILAMISQKILEYNKNRLILYSWVSRLIPELAKTKKLAILTNNSLATVSNCLGILENYFSIIKTWENVAKLKPAPDGLLCLCRDMAILPSNTLMVGDSEEDFITAKKAGAMSLIVSGNKHFEQFINKF